MTCASHSTHVETRDNTLMEELISSCRNKGKPLGSLGTEHIVYYINKLLNGDIAILFLLLWPLFSQSCNIALCCVLCFLTEKLKKTYWTFRTNFGLIIRGSNMWCGISAPCFLTHSKVTRLEFATQVFNIFWKTRATELSHRRMDDFKQHDDIKFTCECLITF